VELTVRRASANPSNRYDQANSLPLPEYPKRAIRLKRVTGEETLVDLERFRLTGDFSYNPYLRNDDVLIFPEIDPRVAFISISGAVNKPGRIQFVPGDRVADAILFGGGLNADADSLSAVLISRLDSAGQHDDSIAVPFAANPLLSRGDRVWVRQRENERRDYRVTVSGEVNQPGSFPITKNNTTVREVIHRAGGFKPTADKWRAELIRGANVFQSLFFTEPYENLMMLRSADISIEDSLVFAIDSRLRFQRGNGLIDFAKIDSSAGDFLVRDGDFIFVPEVQNLVYVFGQVESPGYVPYVVGQGYVDYVEKAGGKTPTARDEVYLISGKTRSWSRLDDGKKEQIEPGDFLWIPKTPRRPVDFYLTRIAAVAQIVGTLATLALLIKQY
jgi:protein involved in polysaccharide export with SLBB domain